MNRDEGNTKKKSNQYCTPAYTPHQVARVILEFAREDPNISAKMISQIVKAKGLYFREPPPSHFRSLRQEIMCHLTTFRAVEMASMDDYIKRLPSGAIHHQRFRNAEGTNNSCETYYFSDEK